MDLIRKVIISEGVSGVLASTESPNTMHLTEVGQIPTQYRLEIRIQIQIATQMEI